MMELTTAHRGGSGEERVHKVRKKWRFGKQNEELSEYQNSDYQCFHLVSALQKLMK